MHTHTLTLITDRLGAGERVVLDACHRALHVVEGYLVARAAGTAAALDAGGGWCGTAAVDLAAGPAGARVLRFELRRGVPPPDLAPAVPDSRVTLAAPVALPAAEVLLRCDRVEFPPGGEALTHVHQGPGIRCLVTGGIRIDTQGHSAHYAPGEAWFETGPDPVYAAAASDVPSAFVRVMILPRACLGRSSIRYVRPEDADRPKTQKYRIYADEPIEP